MTLDPGGVSSRPPALVTELLPLRPIVAADFAGCAPLMASPRGGGPAPGHLDGPERRT